MKDWNFHCGVLGVAPDAGIEQIRKAYRENARILHPDKHGDSELAKRKFQQLGESYQLVLLEYEGRERRKKFQPTDREWKEFQSYASEVLLQFDAYCRIVERIKIVMNYSEDLYAVFSLRMGRSRPTFQSVLENSSRLCAEKIGNAPSVTDTKGYLMFTSVLTDFFILESYRVCVDERFASPLVANHAMQIIREERSRSVVYWSGAAEASESKDVVRANESDVRQSAPARPWLRINWWGVIALAYLIAAVKPPFNARTIIGDVDHCLIHVRSEPPGAMVYEGNDFRERTPEGAMVYEGDKYRGETPVVLAVPCKRTTFVSLWKAGYSASRSEVRPERYPAHLHKTLFPFPSAKVSPGREGQKGK